MKCEICGESVDNLYYLSMHLIKNHKNTNKKKYYDNYLKKNINEGICLACDKKTTFLGLGGGYSKFCSIKCSTNNKEVKEKYKQTCLEKYGVENVRQYEPVKEKYKQTCLEKYGVESSNQSEIVKQKKKEIFFEKFGGPAPYSSEVVRRKGEQTCLKHFGETSNLKNKEWIEKNKLLMIEKYGVDNYSKTLKFRELAGLNMINWIEKGFKDNKKFTPMKGLNENFVFNELQFYCSYKLLEDQQIGHKFPDRLINELKIAIEYDESHHLLKSAKLHDKIKDKYYISKGYTVLRIKESDWFEDKELQIIKVQETIKFLEQTKLLK